MRDTAQVTAYFALYSQRLKASLFGRVLLFAHFIGLSGNLNRKYEVKKRKLLKI